MNDYENAQKCRLAYIHDEGMSAHNNELEKLGKRFANDAGIPFTSSPFPNDGFSIALNDLLSSLLARKSKSAPSEEVVEENPKKSGPFCTIS